jgi:hypothetical protein
MFPAVYNANMRILQSEGLVAITYELVHDTRVIPIDASPRKEWLSEKIRMYMGDARGHWEGTTLVVETSNLKATTRGSSPALRLVERFTRTGRDSIDYQVTFIDPATWTAPWTAALDMKKRPDDAGVFDYASRGELRPGAHAADIAAVRSQNLVLAACVPYGANRGPRERVCEMIVCGVMVRAWRSQSQVVRALPAGTVTVSRGIHPRCQDDVGRSHAMKSRRILSLRRRRRASTVRRCARACVERQTSDCGPDGAPEIRQRASAKFTSEEVGRQPETARAATWGDDVRTITQLRDCFGRGPPVATQQHGAGYNRRVSARLIAVSGCL